MPPTVEPMIECQLKCWQRWITENGCIGRDSYAFGAGCIRVKMRFHNATSSTGRAEELLARLRVIMVHFLCSGKQVFNFVG